MVIFLMRMDNSHTAEKVVTSQFKSYEVMKLNLRSQEFQEYSLKSTHIATFVQPSEGPQNIHGPQL